MGSLFLLPLFFVSLPAHVDVAIELLTVEKIVDEAEGLLSSLSPFLGG